MNDMIALKNSTQIRVSVILTGLRESRGLRDSVAKLHTFLSTRFPGQFEILLPIDGPGPEGDNLRAVGINLRQSFAEIELIGNLDEAILSATPAFQRSVRAARGHWIFVIGSGSPFDLSFFDQAAAKLQSGYDFVTGNRRLMESHFTMSASVLPLAYGRHRLGLLFNRLVRRLFGLYSRDTQAGIKAMTRTFALHVSQVVTCPEPFHELEHFLVAQQNGYSHAELPVHLHLQHEKSAFRLTFEAGLAAYWLAKLFWLNRRGRYSSLHHVLRGYDGLPWPTRLFLALRWRLTPYLKMIRHLPKEGRIANLGSGYGLFSIAAASQLPSCQVSGYDHDRNRVLAAQDAGRRFRNLDFQIVDLRDRKPLPESTSAVTIIDALHYFPFHEQEKLLQEIYQELKPAGTLLIREVDRSAGPRSFANRVYERFVTAIGFTKTVSSACSFRSPNELAILLRSKGYSVTWARCSHFLFADVLFVATKDSPKLPLIPSFPKVHFVADDWGLSPAVNRGILTLAKKGLINGVSVMADAPFAEEGLKELQSVPGIELGLHFNLTYRAKFSSPVKLLLSWIMPGDRAIWSASIAHEFCLQMDRLLALGIDVKHIDGHHHAHLFPGVLPIIAPLARQYSVEAIRLPADGALWLSRRAPLLLFCRWSKPLLDQWGFKYRPCYYPHLSYFRNPQKLHRALKEKSGHEIILHPADENDFGSVSCPDRYADQRVTEFLGLYAASYLNR